MFYGELNVNSDTQAEGVSFFILLPEGKVTSFRFQRGRKLECHPSKAGNTAILRDRHTSEKSFGSAVMRVMS